MEEFEGITGDKRIAFPSLIGDFRPVRFSTGIENKAAMDNLCIEYSGKRYFVGNMARRQSQPRVTMGAERFADVEGMALMLTTLAVLAEEDYVF